MQTTWIKNKKCLFFQSTPLLPTDAFVIYLALGPEDESLFANIVHALKTELSRQALPPFLLAGFESENWNSDYSPFKAPALFEAGSAFSGNADKTRHCLEDDIIPYVQSFFSVLSDPPHNIILGYSLAGLFSLWTFYSGRQFIRCGSCSGSLWFDGWEDFLNSQTAPQNSHVYLSLGRKEEKVRNLKMASVGMHTRSTFETLKKDASIIRCTLQYHNGGHFHEINKRIAQAVIWLLLT